MQKLPSDQDKNAHKIPPLFPFTGKYGFLG